MKKDILKRFLKQTFGGFTRFEIFLWLISMVVIAGSYIFSGSGDVLTIIASVIGVTSLIFTAKGDVIGQFLIIAFSVLYGIISFFFAYYGEMITYLCMTTPIAMFSVFTWMRHPFEKKREVEISRLRPWAFLVIGAAAAVVTFAFYFILEWMGTANLLFSTISVATSFYAAALAAFRSPYYAIVYALNDIVLIILWIFAAVEDLSYLPMIICFVMFLINDLYGFYCWEKRKRIQHAKRLKEKEKNA